MENMKIWEQVKAVPAQAKKKITGGKLNNMTDINPMWRYQMLTALFGPIGVGWFYEVINKWLEPGANGEVAAFVDVNLYVKIGDEWSKPIAGTGGSKFINNFKSGAETSDEAYKMATTDALSVCCKMLGIGADVYWENGANLTPKKTEPKTEPKTETEPKSEPKPQTKYEEKEKVPVDDELPEPTPQAQAKAEAVDEAKVMKARAIEFEGKTLGEILDNNPEELKKVAGATTDKNVKGACVFLYNNWAANKTA